MKEYKTESDSGRDANSPASKPRRQPASSRRAEPNPRAESAGEADWRLAATLANLADGFVIFDREWRYLFVNPAAARMLGKPVEELLGRTAWEVFPQSVSSPVYQHYHRAVAENIPVQFEYYDPDRGWFEKRCQPTREGLAVYFSDITARKQAEAAVRENEQRLHLAVETAGLGFYARDLATNQVAVNARFRAIIGLPPEGRLESDLAPRSLCPEDRDRVGAESEPGQGSRFWLELKELPVEGVDWTRLNCRRQWRRDGG